MRWALGICAVIALAACSRSFPQAPQVATLQQGSACEPGGTPCISGTCADGVCCEHPCQPDERCDLPMHVGLCTARPLGEPCDAGAMCPTGFCVNEVCCNGACTGPDAGCFACNVPGSFGTCAPVPDNQDFTFNKACIDQPCSACFGGICAPAIPDTDPDHSCNAGTACTVDQRCGVDDGGSCMSNSECATGRCIAGACLHLDDEVVLTASMNPFADARDVASVANSPQGDLAILFTESQLLFDLDGGIVFGDGGLGGLPVENAVFLALQPAGGAWSAVPLFNSTAFAGPVASLNAANGAVVMLGRHALALSARDAISGILGDGGCGGGSPCGVFAVSAAATGEVGAFEEIDPAATGVGYMDALVDVNGNVDLIYSTSSAYHVRQRSADGTWRDLADSTYPADADPDDVLTLQAVGADLFLAYGTQSCGVALVFVDGGAVSSVPSVGCSGITCDGLGSGFFDVNTAKGPPRSDHLALAAMCNTDSSIDPGDVHRLLYTPGDGGWFEDLIGPKLGALELSSDGEWSAQSHLLVLADSDGGSFTTDYGVMGTSWLKPNHQWSSEDVLRLVAVQRPNPSFAISGDGAFPFAAYGIDAYDITAPFGTSGMPPGASGSELHAVYVHR